MNAMKSWISVMAVIVALVVAMSVVSVSANAEDASAAGFRDVPAGHWARAQIEQAVEKGYVSGFPDGTFRPEEKVSRAQFIRMLVDAMKLPHVEQGEPWYQPYVAAVIELGFHKAKDFDSEYDKSLTRLEMTRLIDRAFQVDTGNFTDKGYVIAATENGLIHGKDRRDLNINGFATRAESVVVIERVLEKKRGHKIPVSEEAVEAARDL